MMIKRRTLLLFGLFLIFFTSAAMAKWQTEATRSFAVGLSTTAGNHIFVQRVVFDNEWWAAGGDIKGSWQKAVSTTLIFDRRMPREARVRWRQEDSGVNYQATVRLAEDLTRQARALPEFTWISDSETDRGIYLIIGMEPNGQVTVWLSNAPHENNLRGRVLHVVGEAQAVEVAPAVDPE